MQAIEKGQSTEEVYKHNLSKMSTREFIEEQFYLEKTLMRSPINNPVLKNRYELLIAEKDKRLGRV